MMYYFKMNFMMIWVVSFYVPAQSGKRARIYAVCLKSYPSRARTDNPTVL
jgi:hypothetical protein